MLPRDRVPGRQAMLQEAKTIFEAMVHDDDHSLFKEVAEWNLAMTYLKLDNDTSLKKTLEGSFSKKIICIVNKLRNC